jgi:hypothetical protein
MNSTVPLRRLSLWVNMSMAPYIAGGGAGMLKKLFFPGLEYTYTQILIRIQASCRRRLLVMENLKSIVRGFDDQKFKKFYSSKKIFFD